MESLTVIAQSDIFSTADLGALAALEAELRQTWQTAQVLRTPTEMRVSVFSFR